MRRKKTKKFPPATGRRVSEKRSPNSGAKKAAGNRRKQEESENKTATTVTSEGTIWVRGRPEMGRNTGQFFLGEKNFVGA